MMKIKFLGGAGTVTGSKYLLTIDDKKILVDCGLYQGVKNLRTKNWQKFPVDPSTIDAILLTHAHIDHSGYIPALMKGGFKGPIFSTSATLDLCSVLLPDSGYLQEEDARYANRKHFTKHSPAQPLYTEEDARKSLGLFKPVSTNKSIEISPGITAKFTPVGHILGACAIRVTAKGKAITFSGDVGRSDDLVMQPPQILDQTDYLIVESTYGNRLHSKLDAFEYFEDIINKTNKRNGIVLMPSFAVGRTQINLHIIQILKNENRIPNLPIFLNSPMAITATEIFCRHNKEHKLTAEQCSIIDQGTQYVRTAEESIELNNSQYPSVIISASGMASGGRVLHHLKSLVTHSQNSIVFIGFQAPGTRGDAMVNGASEIKIHGDYYPIKAEVHHNDSLSAHGDYAEIIAWLDHSNISPSKVFVTHGERSSADSMRLKLKDKFSWNVTVPELNDEFELS
ncbi:MAG: metallo-beta-lactamase family protein [Oleiphilaceae bacterium]|jgi:metallo-beta-lactamase family protein